MRCRPTTYAFCLLVVFSLLTACTKKPPPLALALVTNLNGTTEPCGCTSHPRGGLDLLAGLIQKQRQKMACGVVFAGDTFYTFASEAQSSLLWQEPRKASAIADWLGQLQPALLVPGPIDKSRQNELASLLHEKNLPLDWHNLSQMTVSLGGSKLGLIGLHGPADRAQLDAAVAATKLSGAQFVVVVASVPEAADGAMRAQGIPGVQALVIAEGDTPCEPQLLDSGTLLVRGGSKGEYVGLLELHPGGPKGVPWTYYDADNRAKLACEQKQARLLREAGRLPAGPARAARESLARNLDANIALLAQNPLPTGPYYTWSLASVDAEIPSETWAKKILRAYNRSLCDQPNKTCPKLPPQRDRYVGNAACQGCHAASWPVYEQTAHSRAWATLVNAGKECDASCIGCHSVGFEKPGGFCRLGDEAAPYVNVGCENCHGPGAGHAAAPGDKTAWSKQFIARPGEAVCRTCHTPEHSDQFNYATYLPRVLGPGHQAAAAKPSP